MPNRNVTHAGHYSKQERLVADVYKCKDGPDPTRGPAMARLPLAECQTVLGLTKQHFHRDPEHSPRFPTDNPNLAPYAGFRHIVVRVNEAEADDWKPGYYYLPDLSVAEATQRLTDLLLPCPKCGTPAFEGWDSKQFAGLVDRFSCDCGASIIATAHHIERAKAMIKHSGVRMAWRGDIFGER